MDLWYAQHVFLSGAFGGWIGGYFGIHPPKHTSGKILSAFITVNLVILTQISLKKMFNISLCAGGGLTIGNVIRVVVKTLLMGIIYSMAVNYLLGRYVFREPPELAMAELEQPVELKQAEFKQPAEKNQPKDDQPHCCCKNQPVPENKEAAI